MKSEWLTEQEAAIHLGVSVDAFRAWRRKGEAPKHFKHGRTIRYTRESLSEWIAERMHGAEEDDE